MISKRFLYLGEIMKYIAFSAVFFVFGIVAGGINPRMELHKNTQNPIVITGKKDCSSTVGADLASLMNRGLPPSSSSSSSNKPRPKKHRTADEIIEENPNAEELAIQIQEQQKEFEEELSSIDTTELNTARSALELRNAQSRAVLIEDANPDDEQLASIDDALEEMNDSLNELALEFAESFEPGEEPSRREAMSFAAQALDTMLQAEDSMRDALSTNQLESIDDGALDPFSYISPDIIDTLQEFDR
jgi:hypothetical protein